MSEAVAYYDYAKRFWWEKSDASGEEVPSHDVAAIVFDTVNDINMNQADQHIANVRHAKLYSNTDIRSLRGGAGSSRQIRNYSRNAENIIQSVIDTATSMIAKDRPRPTFLTDGADFTDQRLAKQAEKFVAGIFQQTGIYEEMQEVFRDACVFGTGALKIFEEDGEICVERVLYEDITIDEQEARTGMPQQMFQTCYVNRHVLLGMDDWDDDIRTKISMADSYAEPGVGSHDPDMLRVIEAWHVDSNGEDGRHVIAIENELLLDEEWDDGEFPFIFYRWTKEPVGFKGQGLAEQLAPLQLRINRLNRFIDRSQDLISNPRIFLNRFSGINPLHITNEIGQIVEYTGQPPIFHSGQAVPADIYAYKEQLKRSGYELAGISAFASQGVKPQGLESGASLREFHDISSGRFVINAQMLENCYKVAAKRVLKLAKAIYSETKDFTSVFMGRTLIERIDWKDIDVPAIDNFVISIEASSILSQSPAGRLASVIELAQAGLIDQAESRRLLGHPDLERTMDLENAMIENLEATAERLKAGEWVSPQPFQDLPRGMKHMTQVLLKAHNDGAPEEILDLFRRWIETAHYIENPPPTPQEQEVLARQEAAVAPQPGAPGAAPLPQATAVAVPPELGATAPPAPPMMQ